MLKFIYYNILILSRFYVLIFAGGLSGCVVLVEVLVKVEVEVVVDVEAIKVAISLLLLLNASTFQGPGPGPGTRSIISLITGFPAEYQPAF
jgi:hypothetical protein